MTNDLIKINTGLQKYNHVEEIPEELRLYTIVMRNGARYHITGNTKQAILHSSTNFCELPEGDVINKVDVSEINYNKSATVDKYKKSLF